ncbi:PREDICTED: pentatricopeptide repeat-containing protein At2g39230, mitochondrial-like [Prunus mume]|uniref:Pentatricopeptide repeat-containing protein At2g39230, mitochondrial-like n=1 Tax=Prunus mume TaxID=102107 RepID=A0ABM1LNK3_PRUMU|nr:PREDICTED: pentatricopeptide repeat-containing protein At2g39230, mitochondrial-like [Prunus mume]
MKSSLNSSPLPSIRRLSFLNPKFLSSQTQFPKPHLESSLSKNPNPSTNSSQSVTSKSDFPEKATSEIEFHEDLFGRDSEITQTKVISTLLSHRSEPNSALEHFIWAEKERGFLKGVDAFCVLLHILTRFEETHVRAQILLNQYASGDSGPAQQVFFDRLIDCAKSMSLFKHRVVNSNLCFRFRCEVSSEALVHALWFGHMGDNTFC